MHQNPGKALLEARQTFFPFPELLFVAAGMQTGMRNHTLLRSKSVVAVELNDPLTAALAQKQKDPCVLYQPCLVGHDVIPSLFSFPVLFPFQVLPAQYTHCDPTLPSSVLGGEHVCRQCLNKYHSTELAARRLV